MKKLVTLLTVAVFVLTGCGGDPLAGSDTAPDVVAIGSGNFTESQLLAEVYALALRDAGVQVEDPVAIGSREAYFPALQDGSVDLIPDYSGALMTYLDEEATAVEPDEVYAELGRVLPPGLVLGRMSEAENKDAVVVTRETATRLNLRTVADLAPHCPQMTFGGGPEFRTRPDGIPGLAKNYGCAFGQYRSLDSGGPLTVAALEGDDVQAANLFTTDPALPQNDFVPLADPKENFAAQNVVPVVAERKASPQVRAVLDRISAALSTEELLAMNTEAAGPEKPALRTVAADWLERKQLLGSGA
ncbi:L-proline glycine betaine binding ABC transporter protein ProX [Pseudonocardia sp. Ae168_Ps1]|uniref:ABC transporter substrate-binding protein n=1 Tax=unclassified Pseudonocardia TaxID=2619320 RepID=UPI00094AA32F|nr:MULTISPECIES: ABC transporter substrate-binding protein [unclassified Pseudonocardia]OLL73883.1 L-proline glycine betaine binding ABC transporter protein ProX [Pseudonocardia sp. Ae150A_Ps1]OLL79862.1 L-proline glycine betaine binding ABC transporter protein ProX [Pseudonocardia sp. Ae168_Ps1]OLL86004.1 L-proline glycine betaine binding ABC transporter protein ProX [Pseudonocardia sp. Ae263_Ps1]OLL93965.1 L-proline glycine betaine binding ABC transporter protein ProX [Pseudonocardia sp. Ae35